jgi:hypothetical protein
VVRAVPGDIPTRQTELARGNLLKCPKCRNPFSAACKINDDPYFELFGEFCEQVSDDNHPDLAGQRNRLVREKFGFAADSSEVNNYIKCDNCGHIDSMAVWLLRPTFDNAIWPTKVTITTRRTAKPDSIGRSKSRQQHQGGGVLSQVTTKALLGHCEKRYSAGKQRHNAKPD